MAMILLTDFPTSNLAQGMKAEVLPEPVDLALYSQWMRDNFRDYVTVTFEDGRMFAIRMDSLRLVD